MISLSTYRDLRYLCHKVYHNITTCCDTSKPYILNYKGTKQPVVLVHGSGGNQTQWLDVLDRLKEQLPSHPIYAFSLPYSNNIEGYSKSLNDKFNEYDITNPVLVGHSMGGLVAAYWNIHYNNGNSVIFAISSPFHGAPLLHNYCLKLCCNTHRSKQMTPGSAFLKGLLDKIQEKKCVIYTYGSNHDAHVPDRYAELDRHLTFNDYGHYSIGVCEPIWDHIISKMS